MGVCVVHFVHFCAVARGNIYFVLGSSDALGWNQSFVHVLHPHMFWYLYMTGKGKTVTSPHMFWYLYDYDRGKYKWHLNDILNKSLLCQALPRKWQSRPTKSQPLFFDRSSVVYKILHYNLLLQKHSSRRCHGKP